MKDWQKLGWLMLVGLPMISHASTYVVDTLGGAALQPLVQHQLNQLPNGGHVMVYQDRPSPWTTIGYVNHQAQTHGSHGSYRQSLQSPIQLMVR